MSDVHNIYTRRSRCSCHTLFFTPSFLCCKNQSLLKLFQIMLWVQCQPLYEWMLAFLMTQTHEKLIIFLSSKTLFSFISRSPSSCWDTLLAHEAKWHFQPKLVIWSRYYFHSLKTWIGDLKYYFPILYLCLFLRPGMIFPQGKLLSCLRKFWVNSWKLRRTYIFHI